MARSKNNESEGWLNRVFGDWEGSSSFLFLSILLAFLAVGAYLMWDNYGEYVLSQSSYRLADDSFSVSDQPDWIIRSDVTSETVVNYGLAGLSIRQQDLTVVVGQAFRSHAWVKSVNHVTKRHPARVIVDLTYRRPVAMVVVPEGLLPIDAEGVLLPDTDFQTQPAPPPPILAHQYLCITAPEATPASMMSGTAWGDERVHGAAQVAAFLHPQHQALHLTHITAYRGQNLDHQKTNLYYVLRSRDGTTVIWGRAPGMELSGEPRAEQKLARLHEYVQSRGSLSVDQPGQTIDLRRADGLKLATLPEELR